MACVFCDIIDGTIPAAKEYEDEQAIAIRDRHPKAPVHILIIPKQHIVSLAEATADDPLLLGHLLLVVKQVAASRNLAGYKTVINIGRLGGQVIDHLHIHLLGGKDFSDKE